MNRNKTEMKQSKSRGNMASSKVKNASNNEEKVSQVQQQELYQKSLWEICELLATMNNAQDVSDFFECLFTKPELKDFSKRWSLVKELYSGTTQREIAKKFGISLCNITRGSKELRKENSAFRKALQMLKDGKVKK